MGENLATRFTPRAPTDEQTLYIKILRETFKAAAENIAEIPMDPRCQALAVTKLEEASMWANKGMVFA